MPQILQSFIISLSSLQSPWCQPFLIKMAEKKAGLAAQPVTTSQPRPAKGWRRQGRQPPRCLFHRDRQILFTPVTLGDLKGTGRLRGKYSTDKKIREQLRRRLVQHPWGSVTTQLTSTPTCSRSSADLLCSTALRGRRGKHEKGSGWRNISIGSPADKGRVNLLFPLSRWGGLELREAWERDPGETTTGSPPDPRRTGANTTLGIQKTTSSSAETLQSS